MFSNENWRNIKITITRNDSREFANFIAFRARNNVYGNNWPKQKTQMHKIQNAKIWNEHKKCVGRCQ